MIENLCILHDRCNHDCLKSVSISNCKFFKHQGLPSPFTVSKFLDVVVQKSTWQSPGIIEWTSGTTFFKNCILNNKNKLSCTYNNFRIDEKTRWKLMVYDKIETRLREKTKARFIGLFSVGRVFIMFVPPSSRLRRQPARITTTETRRRIPQSPELHPTGKPLRKLLHGRVTPPRSWSSFTSAALHIVIGVVTAVRGGVPGF